MRLIFPQTKIQKEFGKLHFCPCLGGSNDGNGDGILKYPYAVTLKEIWYSEAVQLFNFTTLLTSLLSVSLVSWQRVDSITYSNSKWSDHESGALK